MNVRTEVEYRGTVQGVGFRATAVHLARDLPIHGFVQNRPDGTVRLIAEGDETDVQTLLQRIGERMWHRIESTDRRPHPPTGETGGFRIA
jgi:acylphosphatase